VANRKSPDGTAPPELALIIHERFCCNRRSLTHARRARRARKAGRVRLAKKFWVLSFWFSLRAQHVFLRTSLASPSNSDLLFQLF
jgi:hypothetical protein